MTPQQQIAHYRITARLGQGGMGEVYRATDTKLDREVAIKILPEAFAQNTERMARFQREAKVLASLNHPNIAAIYGVEEQALVMELVEGPTLADRIARGRLPLDEVLAIARQIAEAVDAAHEKGIIHRDLKPANIKVTPEGVVKVLDFGLAKAAEEPELFADSSISPTLTLAASRVGVLVGTAGYMSPEQARGKPVNKGADIWAFGVVLYEMLTGKRLFDGETVSDTLAQVLTKEPDWNVVPREVQRLLRACLERDPKARLRDISDTWRLLEETGPPAPVTVARPSKLLWLTTGFLGIATVALGLIAVHHFREQPRVVRLPLPPPEKTVFSGTSLPALSPDGRRLAFTATSEGKDTLWVRDLDALAARPIPGTDGAANPFWSPDSRYVAFFAAGKLLKVDLGGAAAVGPALPLCDVLGGSGGSWGSKDIILFTAGSRGIFSVPAAGGAATPVTAPAPDERTHHSPWFLPDGTHFLYTVASASTQTTGIYVAGVDSSRGDSKRHLIVPTNSNGVYVSGWLLYMREQTLLAQPFDAGTVRATGDPLPIASPVGLLRQGPRVAGLFSAARDGVLAYAGSAVSGIVRLTWFDRSGKVLGTLGAPGTIQWPSIAPDGNTVAFDLLDSVGLGMNVWMHDLRRGTASRFTFNQTVNMFPVWSPDGTHVAFGSIRDGRLRVYQKATDGAAEELLDNGTTRFPVDWSRDGRYLFEEVLDQKTGYDIWVIPMQGDRKPYPYVQTEYNERRPKLSPDGRWLAYESDETNRSEIYVQSFPALGHKWQISTNGAIRPTWSRDGRQLFFLGIDQKMMAVEVKSGTTFEPGVPKPLFDVALGNLNGSYDVTYDGRFLIPVPVQPAGGAPMTIEINWQPARKN